MSKQPLVSIIIPTYNRAHLICETLDSVLAQTYTNWECVVVDDGSVDDTDKVMVAYCDKDSRFQYYHRPKERLPGGNAARNFGFEVSNGELIQWFDSDDIMMPDFIETKIQPFTVNPDSDVVFSAFENVNADGERTRIANQGFSGNILDDLVDNRVSFGPYSFMLRRDKLNNISYDETLKKNQDLDFFFRFFTSNDTFKIIHIKKILFKVNTHDGSMSYGSDRDILKMASIYQVYLMVLHYFVEQNHIKGIHRYKQRCLNILKVMLRNGFYKEVLKRLDSFPYLNMRQKMYLIGCVISQFLIKRGATQFVKIDSKNKLKK